MARAKTFNRGFSDDGDSAQFTLDNSHVEDATFDLVIDEGRKSAEDEEADVASVLERSGIASAEAQFLGNHERKYVISSNVGWIQYFFLYPDGSQQHELLVGYKDGSTYLYAPVDLDLARSFYNASSYGSWVWDNLRTRGDAWGWQIPYQLVAGDRIWFNAGADSQYRHESIPPSGAGQRGYHPAYAWAGAPGKMGKLKGGKNLNARGGSRKVANVIPSQAAFGGFPNTGPFGG